MMNKLTEIAAFVIGAAVGSAITWECVRKRYEQIAQEEIESVKKVYQTKEPYSGADEKKASVKKNKGNIKCGVKESHSHINEKAGIEEYAAKLNKYGYSFTEAGNVDLLSSPHIISPEEFGELDDYEKISLTYYADHILADDDDELIDDIDAIIGLDSLNRFGEYEDDSVFVRNDTLKCDYEILLDHRNYQEVVRPHRREA